MSTVVVAFTVGGVVTGVVVVAGTEVVEAGCTLGALVVEPDFVSEDPLEQATPRTAIAETAPAPSKRSHCLLAGLIVASPVCLTRHSTSAVVLV
ncbi:MAG: hypothetical protein WCI22_15295 [Actinomycetota bacterium]